MTISNCQYDKAIDFHIHLPDQLSLRRTRDPKLLADRLVEELVNARILYAVLIAIETSPKLFARNVNAKKLREAVEDLLSHGLYMLPRYLYKLLEDPEEGLREHLEILKTAHTPSELVLEVAQNSNGRLLPVVSINIPELARDEAASKLEKLLRRGAIGLKILPTIQFIEEKHLDIIDYLATILEEKSRILIIHTGCDPGIWEFPYFCRNANPIFFEEIIRRHKDLTVVLAHTGSYSALRPGIFLHEALRLIRSYENVYGDTAALDREIIEYILSKTPADKILFGSDFPVIVGRNITDSVREICLLPIPDSIKEKILWENAERLLRTLNII